ncbi:MAG: penicillin-binding protein [Marivirga sp.]|nr:penicillin-binding protein [Marivirga sp.]
MKSTLTTFALAVLLSLALSLHAQPENVPQKLKGFDKTIEKILKDWNVPGCGIGIVVKDKLVFAKGYGYRDLEKKLPVTPSTLFQIASNTKLFTATAIGFLVEEGKLDWDKPIRNYVPQIQFYNDELTANVTIRDMLSHRTGISRHDFIWYRSDFTRKELFDRIKYLEPSIPLRQGYLYNNLMYGAAGSVIEYLSNQTWEEFVTSRIFKPLNMNHSMFVTEEMIKQSDFMTPYYERRDTTFLEPFPFYTKFQGVGPCGSIISSINDLSNWVIAQMNGGKLNKKEVIPPSIIKETLQPASLTGSVPDKYFENLNSIYGMGRGSSAYKGHYRTQHGGAIGGIYSNISMMPADSIGVIVYVNGAHANVLPGVIANIIYDKLLNLPETPWSERNLKNYLENKETDRKARMQPDVDRVQNTKPSHALAAYVGAYEDAAYGILKISLENNKLYFNFHNTRLPIEHYHYDRFTSPDDEIDGKWSLAFVTDAQGSINQVKVSLDEKEVSFTRKADEKLSDPEFLKTLTGKYELNGGTINVVISDNGLVIASSPPQHLDPYKNNVFRIREFSDQLVEFLFDSSGKLTGLKVTYDGKNVTYTKKK